MQTCNMQVAQASKSAKPSTALARTVKQGRVVSAPLCGVLADAAGMDAEEVEWDASFAAPPEVEMDVADACAEEEAEDDEADDGADDEEEESEAGAGVCAALASI